MLVALKYTKAITEQPVCYARQAKAMKHDVKKRVQAAIVSSLAYIGATLHFIDSGGCLVAKPSPTGNMRAQATTTRYEEMMLKRRKLEKRLSSQDRTPGHRSGSLTEAREYINAVLYQDFPTTEPLEWWRSEASVKYP
ncbi:hypothetical protein AAVH_23105 [Aphelenchoides avenae]|nr:hypothetical protein AAVH_23105 [Aphelenchus avenae]